MALTPAEKMRKQRLKNPKLRIHAIDLDPTDPVQQRLHTSWQAEPSKKQLFMDLYSAHLGGIPKPPVPSAPDANFVADLKRHTDAAPCNKCNGYADKQDESPTREEIKRYDCGRGYACCTAVFMCRVCGNRFIGGLQAPDFC